MNIGEMTHLKGKSTKQFDISEKNAKRSIAEFIIIDTSICFSISVSSEKMKTSWYVFCIYNTLPVAHLSQQME